MDTTIDTTTHILGPILEYEKDSRHPGGGFHSVCSCTLDIGNLFRVNVELEIREHAAYWEKRNR